MIEFLLIFLRVNKHCHVNHISRYKNQFKLESSPFIAHLHIQRSHPSSSLNELSTRNCSCCFLEFFEMFLAETPVTRHCKYVKPRNPARGRQTVVSTENQGERMVEYIWFKKYTCTLVEIVTNRVTLAGVWVICLRTVCVGWGSEGGFCGTRAKTMRMWMSSIGVDM